ncbi:MAG: hypothetical protein JXR51_15290 [Bacteroidales bacterium]|nr:hypothetical protein [Bacteroidales bacterium]MBN2758535.1 hypothetical protein [Bacteroidales bacterium]
MKNLLILSILFLLNINLAIAKESFEHKNQENNHEIIKKKESKKKILIKRTLKKNPDDRIYERNSVYSFISSLSSILLLIAGISFFWILAVLATLFSIKSRINRKRSIELKGKFFNTFTWVYIGILSFITAFVFTMLLISPF